MGLGIPVLRVYYVMYELDSTTSDSSPAMLCLHFACGSSLERHAWTYLVVYGGGDTL